MSYRLWLSGLLLYVCLHLSGSAPVFAQENVIESASVQELTEEYFVSESRMYLSGGSVPSVSSEVDGFQNVLQGKMPAIYSAVEEDLKKGVEYLNVSVSVTPTQMITSEDVITVGVQVVRVYEVQITHFKETEKFESIWSDYHQLIWLKGGEGLTLIKDEVKFPFQGGTDDSAYLLESVPSDEISFSPDARTFFLPFVVSANGVQSSALQETEKVLAYYDRYRAAGYARAWAMGFNPNYRNFENSGSRGGDCTNFLSQALSYGGWSMTWGGHTSTTSWWYNFCCQSWTWVNPHYLYWYLYNTQRGYNVGFSLSALSVGDVILVDFDRDGYLDHAMIVTYKDGGGNIYLSYHTSANRDREFWSIYRQYPNGAYYMFHLKDWF